jgi:hypothetical protein
VIRNLIGVSAKRDRQQNQQRLTSHKRSNTPLRIQRGSLFDLSDDSGVRSGMS